MLFHTQAFLIFFLIVFGLYWRVNSQKIKRYVLLFSSLIFYMFWSIPFVGLLLLSVSVDYYVGRKIWEGNRKIWLMFSLIVNLGVLVFFKYANFSIDTVNSLSHLFGFDLNYSHLSILLPLGISFYTFQSMSYSIDMYYRKYQPYTSLLDYGLFVCFFPQLIAGPIVRADYFRRQLNRKIRLNWALINAGVTLFVFGLFKKIVFADQAAVFANAVFDSPGDYTSFMAVIGVLAFAFQIYFDFSSYTDMARGLAYLLGYQLPENFMSPYGALGMREFWRKWHISLSTWLRDYLYIPLGGSRNGVLRTNINLMLTMLLGGLWHGAGWNFAIWGGIHGAFLSLENYFFNKKSLRQDSWILNLLIALATFTIVCFAWIFFRAPTLDVAIGVISSIFVLPEESYFHQVNYFKMNNWLCGVIGPALIISLSYIKRMDKTLLHYPLIISSGTVSAMFILSLLIVGGASEFIYFQF